MKQLLLSAIVFCPVIGALFMLFVPSKNKSTLKYLSLIFSFITFCFSCLLVMNFSTTDSGLQFLEKYSWIHSLNINYILGVDGLSIFLIPLTSLLFLLVFVSAWEFFEEKERGLKGYLILFLILETSILGTFLAAELFLFFVFWHLALLPVYFIVSVWGNKNREQAATKFFLYQLTSGAFFLLGMLIFYYATEPHTFHIANLVGRDLSSLHIQFSDRSWRVDHVVFVLFFVGLAVRLPVFPLHGWFPHIQTEAPRALSVILGTVFIETSAYALVRINYLLFPKSTQWIAPVLAVAGVINIIYGGLCAATQRDLRKLFAYFCMSQMGFVLFGMGSLSSTALQGALLQLVSFGICASLFLFLIGMLGTRAQNYQILTNEGTALFGGLVSRAPILTGFFTVAAFMLLGIPGTVAFPSQFLVSLGTYAFSKTLTVFSLFGLLITAGYMLLAYRRIILGAPGRYTDQVFDLKTLEQALLIPLVLISMFIGIYPTPFLDCARPTIERVLKISEGKY